MSNEIPKDEPKKAETVATHVEERELSEDERQTNYEKACCEHFTKDWVIPSSLTLEQKIFVAEFINTQPGAWREYNGEDFKVVEQKVEGTYWKVSFALYFNDYAAQRVDEIIPLSK